MGVMGCVLIAIDFRIPQRMIFHVMLGKVYFKISFMNLFIICLYYIYIYLYYTYVHLFWNLWILFIDTKKKQCLRRSETPFRSFPDPSTIHNKVPPVPPLNFDLGIFPRLLPPVGVLPVDGFTKSPSYIEIPHLLSSTIEAKIAGFRNKPHLLCLG